MYRLHIDMPVGTDQAKAIELAKELQRIVIHSLQLEQAGLELGIRLGNDEDRQRSNYLDINENGHCSNKKIKIVI